MQLSGSTARLKFKQAVKFLSSSNFVNFSTLKFSIPGKINRKVLVAAIIVLAILIGYIVYSQVLRSRQIVISNQTTASVPIEKSYRFVATNSTGEATEENLTLTISSAYKTRDILIQGKLAKARSGKAFLILNLEVDNPYQSKQFLAPVDLIRLIDEQDKKFAPDVHNDQVEIEPISVKKTRVGFVIDESISQFKLQIGEIGGAKDIFDVTI